jgi:hypothetical protein
MRSMLSLAILALCGVVQAQPIPEDPDERLSILTRSVSEYVLTVDGTEKKLDLHAKPILRFDNPVGGVVDGVVMLWTEAGRPAALGQVFVVKSEYWIHEFQSVSSTPFVLTRPRLESPWQPRKAGIKFESIPGAPAPAGTRSGRLTQMKDIARRFSASDDFRVRSEDTQTTKYELRLLPSPAYRYPEKSAAADGALFAFVHGTDPEVVLLLEADEGKWKYACAPLTCWAVQAAIDGKQVWSQVEQGGGKSKPVDPYHVWLFKPSVAPSK